MNNMTVSTSKLTFSLIAISALLISGSGFMVQESFAANPEFTAKHINQTSTVITFDQAVNGTKAILDWAIMKHSCAAPCTTNSNAVAGTFLSEVNITYISNGTVPSDLDVSQSTITNGYPALGYLNASTTITLTHAKIDTDSTYFVNYTANPAHASIVGQIQEAHVLGLGGLPTSEKVLLGFNATGEDWMSPLIVSAEILKSNPNRVEILMSEVVVNVNSTAAEGFSITRTSGTGVDNVASALSGGQNSSKYLYLDFHNRANPGDVLTVSYLTGNANTGVAGSGGPSWITDGIGSARYGAAQQYESGIGNRLANFTGSTLHYDVLGLQFTRAAINIVNWMEIGMFGDVTTCYDCKAPTVSKVQVSLDSSMPITVTDDNKVHINAGIGDTVSVMVTVADNLGADTIPFAGIYTNFGDSPDNLFYSNNFDSTKKMSTSYYEWNVRNDDVAFDNNGAITWNDAIAKVNPDRTQTFTYTMTINDSVDSSQVWVDIGDKVGNYAKIALPITLEVSGAPGLTFASDDTQKVVSFFNESILLAIVSQWTATSSDDATNVEQLSSVLGIESQLPTWTTDLASWVADDKIDVADMIVAVEFVINQ